MLVIFYGTYHDIQKSKYFHFQRFSHCGFKQHPLYKPFTIIIPYVKIICLLGPCKANESDIDVLREEFQIAFIFKAILNWY